MLTPVWDVPGLNPIDTLEVLNNHVKKNYRSKDFFTYLHTHKQSDAKKKGLDYNLDPDFLRKLWTGYCASSGVQLKVFTKSDPDAYSIDRIRPEFGYLKGNVQFISWRRNRIKYNATATELRELADYIESNFDAALVYSAVDINGKLIVDNLE